VIIVDTSVLVNLLRGVDTKAVKQLRQIEREETPFHIPAFCCQELLQGARDEHEWNRLHQNLSTQRILIPKDPCETHIAAARIFFDGRRKGLTVRSSADCFVAQLVLENDGTLLHDDKDFCQIARIRPLKTLS
jgi:predicted nucleic acid-binding protein